MALNWTDVYKIFEVISDVLFPDEDNIRQSVDSLYEINKDMPYWNIAYAKWNESAE